MVDALRGRVLWFGNQPAPEVQRELRNRRLGLTPLSEAPPASQLGAACGAVFSFDSSNVPGLSTLAADLAAPLVDHGLRVELIATNDTVLGQAQANLRGITS